MPKQTGGTGIVERRQAAAKAIESAFPGYQAKTEAIERMAETYWDQLPEETRRRLSSLTPEMLAVLRSVFGGAPGPPH